MLSIMGLLEDNASRQADALLFGGEDLLKKSPKEMRKIQGNRIGMIFQDPMTSLNPLFTVGEQIRGPLMRHQKLSRKEAEAKALAMLEAVGLPSPGRRLKQYPHELSGGMRQRVMIAIAMCCKPELLIADEPTTALDVTIQAQISHHILPHHGGNRKKRNPYPYDGHQIRGGCSGGGIFRRGPVHSLRRAEGRHGRLYHGQHQECAGYPRGRYGDLQGQPLRVTSSRLQKGYPHGILRPLSGGWSQVQ